MKAVMLEAPGNAELSSIPEPRVAGEDEILLQVRKIGLCGTDLNSYRGRNAAGFFSAHSGARDRRHRRGVESESPRVAAGNRRHLLAL